MTLTVIQTENGPAVRDSEGGVWWPSTEAASQIALAKDPDAEAVKMCIEEPMRGAWHA